MDELLGNDASGELIEDVISFLNAQNILVVESKADFYQEKTGVEYTDPNNYENWSEFSGDEGGISYPI